MTSPTLSFSELALAPSLTQAVAEMGYETMTPIQAQAIPVVLTGQDVMGAAQTGTVHISPNHSRLDIADRDKRPITTPGSQAHQSPDEVTPPSVAGK